MLACDRQAPEAYCRRGLFVDNNVTHVLKIVMYCCKTHVNCDKTWEQNIYFRPDFFWAVSETCRLTILQHHTEKYKCIFF